MLPRLRPLVARMVEAKRALDEAQARSDEIDRRISGNGGGMPPAELAEAHGRVRRRAEALAEIVDGIQRLGVAVKDLDSGLVDFPSVREGEPVLLCWLLGEDAVVWWHRYEDGFAGRQPL